MTEGYFLHVCFLYFVFVVWDGIFGVWVGFWMTSLMANRDSCFDFKFTIFFFLSVVFIPVGINVSKLLYLHFKQELIVS